MGFRVRKRCISKNTAIFTDKGKSVIQGEFYAPDPSSSSSSSSYSSQRSPRISSKPRNPRIFTSSNRFTEDRVQDMALPLGMSIAAFVAQVLECSNETVSVKGMAVNHLSMVCSSAVRESLSNTFGARLNSFMANFENSFDITLRTLRSVNRLSLRMKKKKNRKKTYGPNYRKRPPQPYSDDTNIDLSSSITAEEEFKDIEEDNSWELLTQQQYTNHLQVINMTPNPPSNHQLVMQPFVRTVGCLMAEVARHNDLTAERMQIEKEHVNVMAVSNSLKRREIMQGVLSVSLKASRHRTEIEETGYREMRKACVDCLVAGLLIMSASLSYAAYVHSYKRITEATASCRHHFEVAKSWWIPTQVSSMKTGIYILRCQVQVVSRMLFGVLLILAVAYLLLQRSGDMTQTMPITFILLLLGIACGFAGKLCVDTLGGMGFQWLLYWEALCLIHFIAGTWTSFLYPILHGPVPIIRKADDGSVISYGFRRCLFYTIILGVIPVCCGLLPFAGVSEWSEHFWMLFSQQTSVEN